VSAPSEQISQPPQAVERGPTREEIRSAEVRLLVHRASKLRLLLLPLGAAFLSLIAVFDPAPWKSWALAGVIVVLIPLVIYDLRSIRRPRRTELVALDPAIALGLQTALIWATGAIESPLLVIYVPLALIAGLAAPSWRSRVLILCAVSLLLWLMTVGGLLGWLPRTVPRFLDLGPGFHDRPTYALTKAGVVNVVLIIASQLGAAVQRIMNRMLDRAIEAREHAVSLLSDRNRELVQLSGAIAHELKNPLASVQGLVQLLERSSEGRDEREKARLEVLGREVVRMRETLDELLNFSRPLGELTLQTVEPRQLFESLSALHEGIAQARSIQLQLPEGELPSLRADPRKLGQALQNLLQNALEATPEGGQVSWLAEADGEEVLLGLRDSGPGLPAEVLERLGTGGATTKPHGSGIGLAVARAIAEQHGGALLLENLPGGGCRALLRLPRGGPRS
jgi:two-component system, NtrC family, sensor histidine kinase HydH